MKEKVITDRQTDTQTEFPLVDSTPQNNERRIFALHKTPTPLASDRSAGCNFVAQVWLPRTDQLSKTKSNISVLKQINKTVC